MQYKIIESISPIDLIDCVTVSIAEGWEPLGGVAVREDVYVQAMTKKPKRASKTEGAILIKTFLDQCAKKGEQPIPSNADVFKYAAEAGIPKRFLKLCWFEFVERSQDNESKQKNWRSHFNKCVRGDWYKLWYLDAGEYHLTKNGQQAEKKHAVRLR